MYRPLLKPKIYMQCVSIWFQRIADIVRNIKHMHDMPLTYMMSFVVSLNQTFKRALSRRYFLSLDVTLQLFWCKILIYDFQIRKVHAKTRLVVMFSSHQLISTTKNFFDEKKIFFTKILSKNLIFEHLFFTWWILKNRRFCHFPAM